MIVRAQDPRLKAGLVAALLFVIGVTVGVTADRMWSGRTPTPAAAAPLTVEALAAALELDSLAERKVRALLDSMEPGIAQAAVRGADSLQAAARHARRRLEEALPADRRERFRSWMDEHRSRMMEMMRGGRMRGMMDSGRMVPGRMRQGMSRRNPMQGRDAKSPRSTA